VADKTPEEEGERRSREMSDLIRALAKGSPAIEEPPSEKTPLEFRFLDEKRASRRTQDLARPCGSRHRASAEIRQLAAEDSRRGASDCKRHLRGLCMGW
jgi:hypothetical protein